MNEPPDEIPDEVKLPIKPELDLHQFRPRDIPELVPEYLRECQKEGILAVRVIHGKGIGTQRERVHKLLIEMPEVRDFSLAGGGSGSWGATWVYLSEAD